MLQDYYKLYRNQASIIPNWETANKNDLCNAYVDCSDEFKKQAYLSAIVCRYWQALCSSYQKSYMAASEEDVYDWYIDSIIYVLRKVAWRNPDNVLFGDKNGPDKCINIKIKCARLTYFQQNNRFNRKVNHGTESLEKLHEDLGDSVSPSEPEYDYEQTDNDNVYYDWIKREYINGNHLNSLALDLIISSNVFVGEQRTFDIQLLVKQIKKIDEKYYKYFADTYDLDMVDVMSKFTHFKSAPKKLLRQNIEFFFQTLGRC